LARVSSPLGVVLLLASCSGCGDPPPPDPCIPENHCIRLSDGSARCEDGFEWEDYGDDDNYLCVRPGSEGEGEGEGEGENHVCSVATALTGTVTGDTTGLASNFSYCGLNSGIAADLAYSYTASQDANVTFQMTSESIGFAMALSVRTDCEDASSEQYCSSSGSPTIRISNITAGTMLYIIVDGFDGTAAGYDSTEGVFELTVIEEAVTRLESGDACDPRSMTAICDAAGGDACLGVAGSETCTTATVLGAGDTCSHFDTSNVCGPGSDSGLVCSGETIVEAGTCVEAWSGCNATIYDEDWCGLTAECDEGYLEIDCYTREDGSGVTDCFCDNNPSSYYVNFAEEYGEFCASPVAFANAFCGGRIPLDCLGCT
jgi:hypothetical protein